MPNKPSAKKELRKNVKRKARNTKIEDNIKNLTKKSKKAIEGKDEKAIELVRTTLKALDKAAQKGVLKKNTSRRKKSRLHIKLNKMTSKTK